MTSAEEMKACCATAYDQDAVALILGESYHPGGLTLTRQLADALGIRAGQRALDVAAGRGATARLLATEYDAHVDAIDLGTGGFNRAAAAADETDERVQFRVGDAERIPFDADDFDVVVCECAFCTFPDKPVAAAEFARVLRPGGRVGVSDVVVSGELPPQLRSTAAWVACIADARPLSDYVALLSDAGLSTVHTEAHHAALARMIDQIEARVRLLAMTSPDRIADRGVDIDAVLRHTAAARDAVDDGILGYALIVAEKS